MHAGGAVELGGRGARRWIDPCTGIFDVDRMGSFVLDARRDPGCRVGVTIAPTGGMTTVTVLYGAGCPQP